MAIKSPARRTGPPVEKILAGLVAIPSVSSMDNRPVIEYAMRYLDPALWRIDLYPFQDHAGTPKLNLVATTKAGRQRRPALALVCHSDTVPYESAWKEAVHPKVRNGRLFGRGSCDVKGYMACILAAISGLDHSRLSEPLSVVITADEEVGCVGARLLAREKAVRARRLLIGEPTGLHAARAGKGYGLAEIVVTGREAHSAFPEAGVSAISGAARVVAMVEGVASALARRKIPGFRPPYTTVNIGTIRGGTAKNIVPGECRLLVEWRPVPGQPAGAALALIREGLKRLAAAKPAWKARVQPLRLDAPFAPGDDDELAAAIQQFTGKPPVTLSFGTEAPHLASAGVEAVVFGPGDMTTAHRTGEFVPLRELRACVECLEAVIARFCRGAAEMRSQHRNNLK